VASGLFSGFDDGRLTTTISILARNQFCWQMDEWRWLTYENDYSCP
jgi:hypothetical protein